MLVLVATLALSSPSETYLETNIPPATGFDFPVGDEDGKGHYVDQKSGKKHNGWYVAAHFGESYSLGIHPGEDWNGRGGSNTDFGQPVHAIGRGKVISAALEPDPWGGVIVIEHLFYENFGKKRIHSTYVHLSRIDVKKGELVTRRQTIGAIGRDPGERYMAHLHFEIRSDRSLAPTYWPSSDRKDKAWVKEHYLAPTRFIQQHRKTPVPQEEATLVLVDHDSRRLRLYKKGKLKEDVEVGFGQAAGRKRRQGDLKTPKGMYFVVDHYRGKFTGTYGAYYGGHWIKINYPNPFDAAWGREQGLVNASTEKRIRKKWRERKLTKQSTPLGGGIGFHGWIGDWSWDDTGYLSWGCVVMHNEEIKKLYDQIPIGSMVVIL